MVACGSTWRSAALNGYGTPDPAEFCLALLKPLLVVNRPARLTEDLPNAPTKVYVPVRDVGLSQLTAAVLGANTTPSMTLPLSKLGLLGSSLTVHASTYNRVYCSYGRLSVGRRQQRPHRPPSGV